MTDLELNERLTHIDHMQKEIQRRNQEIAYQPWIAAFAGMTAAGALFAAGAPSSTSSRFDRTVRGFGSAL